MESCVRLVIRGGLHSVSSEVPGSARMVRIVWCLVTQTMIPKTIVVLKAGVLSFKLVHIDPHTSSHQLILLI